MMKLFAFLDLKKRPYELLGIMALVLYLVSFMPSNQGAIDINMHDTYFVVANVSFCRIASGILLFLWAMNVLFRRYLVLVKLNQLYVIGTLLSFGIFFYVLFAYHEPSGPPRKYYAFQEFEKIRSHYDAWVIAFVVGILLFIVSQIAFIINIITGLIRKVSKPATSNQPKAD